ncbi:MAG: type II secretion system protein [Candidatus Saccharimonas sp.]|nr:type II secretion system protein [Candidatus Saccharimonas sp.]
MSKAELKQKGFTIIEVVLVLAIAALIFLMVFIALPALQRNQRDQARKTFQSKVSSAVTTYQSNKRGAQPTTGALLAPYFDGAAATAATKSSDGVYTATTNDGYADNQYIVVVNAKPNPIPANSAGNANIDVVQVYTGAKCNATADGIVAGTGRQAAILMKMENGNVVNCQEV